MITKQDTVINDQGLTVRDQTVVKMIVEMINHPTHSRDVIALQECGHAFLQELKSNIPNNFEIIYSSKDPETLDQNIVIYDKEKFNYLESDSTIDTDAYPCQKDRSLMNIALEKGGIIHRVFNSHIPGDPNLPGRFEFAEYVLDHTKKDEVSIALGDMNFDHLEMDQAFTKACSDRYLDNQSTRVTPYKTNTDPYDHCSKAIDHIIVDTKGLDLTVTANNANELCSKVQDTIDLLNTPAHIITDPIKNSIFHSGEKQEGGYVAVYTRVKEDSLYPVGNGTYVLGFVWFDGGQYCGRYYIPEGYEKVESFTRDYHLIKTCESFFPNRQGKIWVGGDTGGFGKTKDDFHPRPIDLSYLNRKKPIKPISIGKGTIKLPAPSKN